LDVEEAKENIKELFVQLLNKLDIEYTSELVDCLVTLAVKYELKDFIKNDDKDTAVLQAAGTHEIIKHLFAALDSAKDMVAQACRIGRSVLQLCDPSLA
jgi:2-hydroxy-3-keto-5-methylthiopentenyl-1-phosphate phosphatase